MDDAKIVRLYWDRDERAIPATADKYGRYCTTIAKNILGNNEDAEECVNDTYLNAWKRGKWEVPVVLEELIEIVSDTDSIEQEIDHQELVKAIDEFLGTLSSDKRNIFVRGYWYFDSISEIATHFKMTPGR